MPSIIVITLYLLSNLNNKTKFSEINEIYLIGKYIKYCESTNQGSINSVCEDEKMRESYREETIFRLGLDE